MKKIISIIAASLCMVSCVDTVILPDDKLVEENMWQTKSDVAGIVACAYNQLRDESLMRNFIVWGDFRSDELVVAPDATLTYSSAYKQDLMQIYALNILPNNSFTNWNALYSAINYCNLVLERAENVMSIDPNYTLGDYQVDCSKVKALRALCYFYLVRVFRDVPVSTKAYTASEQEMLLEQQSPASVLEMCINDLVDAEKNAISSSAYGDWRDKGYMTRDAIDALLADIYLWRASVTHSEADYQSCIDYCDKVILSKKKAHVLKLGEEEKDYYLVDKKDYYEDVFSESGIVGSPYGQNSEESIFEVQYNSYKRSSDTRYQGILHTNTGLFQMYHKFANNNSTAPYLKTTTDYGKYNAASNGTALFKNTEDVRQNEFIYGANSSEETFLVRKYVATGSYSNNSSEKRSGRNLVDFHENWIIYRLTDVMLMKAEALVQLYEASDKSDETYLQDAFALVDVVNRRALNENTTNALKYSTYKSRMEQLVMDERARELCFEGKRWFDLMRYNYRHVEGVQYDLTFAQMGGNYVNNYSEMLTKAMGKKYSTSAIASKMPTEPYLYWPINTVQMDVNDKLQQNPVWRATSSTERN